MFLRTQVGTKIQVVESDGWTHRIGIHNPSRGRLTEVSVRLVAVTPAPRFPVLPVTLRKKDDNIAPYTDRARSPSTQEQRRSLTWS